MTYPSRRLQRLQPIAGVTSTLAFILVVLFPVGAVTAPGPHVDVPADVLEFRFTRAIDAIADSTVHVDTEDGMGSGTVIDTDGHILTSAHVIEGSRRLTVTLSDRRRLRARVVGINGAGDLAVLKIDAKDLVPARFGGATLVGDWVLAAGHPAAAFDDYQPTLAVGRVRQLDMSIRANGGRKVFHNAVVSDAPLSAGASGGGLFDLEGRLVGVNAAVSRGERLAYSVPLSEFVADRVRLLRGERFDRVARRPDGTTRRTAKSSRQTWFRKRLPHLARSLSRVQVRVTLERESWGGFVVSSGGDVLTLAAPLVRGGIGEGDEVRVRLEDGVSVQARVVALDLANGVALLRLPWRRGRDYDFLDFGRRTAPERGTLAIVRNYDRLEGGIVSALRRVPSPRITSGMFFADLVQVDLRLGRAASGAPVVDRRGTVLGMVVQHRLLENRDASMRDPYGAFLLPANQLEESYVQLRERGSRAIQPVGFFGVELIDMTESEKVRRRIRRGVLVGGALLRRGPAWRAGIRPGDVIESIGELTVASRQEAVVAISARVVGSRLPVRLLRRGRQVTVDVEVGDRWKFMPQPTPYARR